MIEVFNCFLQGDKVPLRRNVFFDRSFFSTSRSRVPIVNTEFHLLDQSVEYVVVKVIFLTKDVKFSAWCLAERCIGFFHIDNVAPKSVLGVRFHPCRKTISYGRDVFLITGWDLFVRIRQYYLSFWKRAELLWMKNCKRGFLRSNGAPNGSQNTAFP